MSSPQILAVYPTTEEQARTSAGKLATRGPVGKLAVHDEFALTVALVGNRLAAMPLDVAVRVMLETVMVRTLQRCDGYVAGS